MLTGAQYRQEVSEARKKNDVVTNLPSLAAFAEKADGRYKSRWVCSCDKAQDTWGDTATTDLDPGLLREAHLPVCGSSGHQYRMPQLPDTRTSQGRKIFLRPPPAFVRAGLIPRDAMYAVERGVYGLREAPKWRAEVKLPSYINQPLTHRCGFCPHPLQSIKELRRWLMMPVDGRTPQEHLDILWSVSHRMQSKLCWECMWMTCSSLHRITLGEMPSWAN
eukprot:5190945-Amphidinium_carterae.2